MAKQTTTTKKPHWLSTPEGRAKMSRIQKARYARAREEMIARNNTDQGSFVRELRAQTPAHLAIERAKAKRVQEAAPVNYSQIAAEVVMQPRGVERLMIAIGLELLRVQNNHG
jgi:hypothetical protein